MIPLLIVLHDVWILVQDTCHKLKEIIKEVIRGDYVVAFKLLVLLHLLVVTRLLLGHLSPGVLDLLLKTHIRSIIANHIQVHAHCLLGDCS